MDLWQKYLGYKDPTLIEVVSERWLALPESKKLDAVIDRRARKEKWGPTGKGEGGAHEFHCLATIKGGAISGYLEVVCLGLPIATLTREESESAMAQMRDDNHLRATAVRTRALRGEGGHWQVSLNL